MGPSSDNRLTNDRRRAALSLGLVNGALWSAGNGLTTGAFVLYLAQELSAKGMGVSLIIAAPSLAGLLRLVAPPLIDRFGGVKRTCLIFFTSSYLLLATGLPTLIFGRGNSLPENELHGRSRSTTIALLVALICVHQLLEYIASVALWSWLAAIVPLRVRGRYFGRRQAWQLAVLAPALLAGGIFIDQWKNAHREKSPERVLFGYGITTGVGAWILVASIIPLAMMPVVASKLGRPRKRTAAELFNVVQDGAFRRLLAYRAWFSFFNGVGQAALNIYPYRVLQISLLPMQMMPLGMRMGQLACSPTVGRVSDVIGNRPVLIASQALVAVGPLFYLAATPNAPWWIVGAWIAYVAYAGTNICLPNLMLKLAPPAGNAAYIAVAESISGLAYGISVIAGGLLFDALATRGTTVAVGSTILDHFGLLFVFGVVTRVLGVLWLMRIQEPGARKWRDIVTGR